MKTYSALFAGFDLAGKGLEAAGLEPINLFEIDPVLADVGQANSTGKYVVADICDVDFKRYERPDVMWASPVCKNASQANVNGEESVIDVATAEATVRAIEAWMPEVVFIENVWQYRHFKAFGLIMEALNRLGYWSQVHHLNSADYGVPQTRKRLIVRASRSGWLPPLPTPEPWRGWYDAIEDLIPTLPETEFAQWQLDRLPDGFRESVVVEGDVAGPRPPTSRKANLPIWTLKANMGEGRVNTIRAFICEGSAAGVDNKYTMPVRGHDKPVFTMRAKQNMPRAFLLGDQHRRFAGPDLPAFTVTANEKGGTAPRAFITSGGQSPHGIGITVRNDDEPVNTVVANQDRVPARAWLNEGRVVSMTPRALGRFQTLPDSFELPDKLRVACTGIGNGVPCLMVEKLMKGFLE